MPVQHFVREGGLRGGRAKEYAILSGVFLTYMLQTYLPHIDISNVAGGGGGGTWPVAFYFLLCPQQVYMLLWEKLITQTHNRKV